MRGMLYRLENMVLLLHLVFDTGKCPVNSLYDSLLISPDPSWGNSELQKPCPRRLWFYVVANNSGFTSVLFDFLFDNDWDVCNNFTSALSVQ